LDSKGHSRHTRFYLCLIFAIIGPAFNTVIGAFVGLLGGLSIGGNGEKKEIEEPPVADEPYQE